MRDDSLLWTGLCGLFSVLYAAAIALALGAVWMALSLRMPSAHWWFALPAGLAMGYTARSWVTRRQHLAIVLAVCGVPLAAIYMKCLYVGLQLAAVMGLGFVHTLQRAGVGMLLALAHASLDPRLVFATLAGMVLAGWMAWHRGGHPQPSEQAP